MFPDARIYRLQTPVGVLPAPEDHGAEWCASSHWNKLLTPFFLPADVDIWGGPAAEARVQRGYWIVDCPCNGAQYACRTDHRMFCPDCLNEYAGGAWVPVSWPDDLTVAAIEATLSVRPFERNRNWLPDESVEDLLAENERLG